MKMHWNFSDRIIEVENMSEVESILDDEFPVECGGWKIVGNNIFDGENGREVAQIVY